MIFECDKNIDDREKYSFLLGSAMRNEDTEDFFCIYDNIMPKDLTKDQLKEIKQKARLVSELSDSDFNELVSKARHFSLAPSGVTLSKEESANKYLTTLCPDKTETEDRVSSVFSSGCGQGAAIFNYATMKPYFLDMDVQKYDEDSGVYNLSRETNSMGSTSDDHEGSDVECHIKLIHCVPAQVNVCFVCHMDYDETFEIESDDFNSEVNTPRRDDSERIDMTTFRLPRDVVDYNSDEDYIVGQQPTNDKVEFYTDEESVDADGGCDIYICKKCDDAISPNEIPSSLSSQIDVVDSNSQISVVIEDFDSSRHFPVSTVSIGSVEIQIMDYKNNLSHGLELFQDPSHGSDLQDPSHESDLRDLAHGSDLLQDLVHVSDLRNLAHGSDLLQDPPFVQGQDHLLQVGNSIALPISPVGHTVENMPEGRKLELIQLSNKAKYQKKQKRKAVENKEIGAAIDENDNPVVPDVGLTNSEWQQMRQSPSTGGQTVGNSESTTYGKTSSSDLFRSHNHQTNTEDPIPKVSKHKRLLEKVSKHKRLLKKVSKHKRFLEKEQKETKKAEDVENYKGNLSLDELMYFIGVQNVSNKKLKKNINKPNDISDTSISNKKYKDKKQKSISSNCTALVELQGGDSAQPASLGVQCVNMGNTSVKSVIPVENSIDRIGQLKDDNANFLNLLQKCTTKTSVSAPKVHSNVCNDDTNKAKESLTTKNNRDASGEKINNGKAASKTVNLKDASNETIDESKKFLESKAKTDTVGMPNDVTMKLNVKNKKAKQTDQTAKPASESSMLDSYHESLTIKNNMDAYSETRNNENAASKKRNNKIASSETIDKCKKHLEIKDKTATFQMHCSKSVENVSGRVGMANNMTINPKNTRVRQTNPKGNGIPDNHLIFTDVEVPLVPWEDKSETVGNKNKNTAKEISQENNFLKCVANHKKNRHYDKCQISTNNIRKKPPIGTQYSAIDSDLHVHDSNPSAFPEFKSGRSSKSLQKGCCNSTIDVPVPSGLKVQDDSDIESVKSLPITQDSLASPSVTHKKYEDGHVHHVDSLQPHFAAKYTKNEDNVNLTEMKSSSSIYTNISGATAHPSVQSHEPSKVKSGNSGGFSQKQKPVIFLDKHVEEIPTNLDISFGFESEPADINLGHIEFIDTVNSVKLERKRTHVINDVCSQENIQFLDDVKYIGNNDMNPPSESSSNTCVISNGSVQNHEAKSTKVRKASKHFVKITNFHLHSQDNIQFLEDEKDIQSNDMNSPSLSSSNSSVISNGLKREVNEDMHMDKCSQTSKFRDTTLVSISLGVPDMGKTYVYYGEGVTTGKKEFEGPSQTNGPTKYCGVIEYREEMNLKSNFKFAEALMFLNTEWDRTRILHKNESLKLKVILK